MKLKKCFILLSMSLVCICVSACLTRNDMNEKKVSQGTAQDKIKSIELPETYNKVSGEVTYNLTLELPEHLDTTKIRKGVITGSANSDEEKAKEYFGLGQKVKEERKIPTDHADKFQYSYKFGSENTSSLGAGGPTLTYTSENASFYFSVWDKTEKEDWEKKDILEFADVDTCIENVKEGLEYVGYPTELEFHNFTVRDERLSELEEHISHDGEREEENYKESWLPEDSAYVIMGRQVFDGVPIHQHMMTAGRQLAFDNFALEPVKCVYTSRGIEYLSVGILYNIQETDEYFQLKSFEDIISVVDNKLNGIITEEGCQVYRSKFIQLVQMNEKQEFDMVPAWYFEYEIPGETPYKSVILIDAVTGEELSHW